MSAIQSICVYCGANGGFDARFAVQAANLGQVLAARHIRLIYGGSTCGTMGVLAKACLEAGGEVLGVIPRFLDEQVESYPEAGKIVVEDMAERKRTFLREADALVALPGGVGTAEELLEAICWQTLGLNRKPVGMLDAGGFFAPLTAWLDSMVAAGFYHPEYRQGLIVSGNPAELIDRLAAFQYRAVKKWNIS